MLHHTFVSESPPCRARFDIRSMGGATARRAPSGALCRLPAARRSALRALPPGARAAEAAGLRALRLARTVAGPPLCGVLRQAARFRDREGRDRVRRAGSRARVRLEGGRTAENRADGGRARARDGAATRGGGSRPCAGRPGAREGAGLRASPGSCPLPRGALGPGRARPPPPHGTGSPTARPRPRRAPAQRKGKRRPARTGARGCLPRRRRVHVRSDGRRLRHGAATSGCAARGGGHLCAGRSLG